MPGYFLGFSILYIRPIGSSVEANAVFAGLAIWLPEVIFAYGLIFLVADACHYNKARWPFAISGLIVSLSPLCGPRPTYFLFHPFYGSSSQFATGLWR